MTMTRNDYKWNALNQATGLNATINDMEWKWLSDHTLRTDLTLHDQWVYYLNGQGYTGMINGMQFDVLGDLGYTGTLNDWFFKY